MAHPRENEYLKENLFGLQTSVLDTSYVVYNLYLRRLRELQARAANSAASMPSQASAAAACSSSSSPAAAAHSSSSGIVFSSVVVAPVSHSPHNTQKAESLLSSSKNRRGSSKEEGNTATTTTDAFAAIKAQLKATVAPVRGSSSSSSGGVKGTAAIPPPPPVAEATVAHSDLNHIPATSSHVDITPNTMAKVAPAIVPAAAARVSATVAAEDTDEVPRRCQASAPAAADEQPRQKGVVGTGSVGGVVYRQPPLPPPPPPTIPPPAPIRGGRGLASTAMLSTSNGLIRPLLSALVEKEQLSLGDISQRASKQRHVESLLPPTPSTTVLPIFASLARLVSTVSAFDTFLLTSVFEQPLPSSLCPRSSRVGVQTAVREGLSFVRQEKAVIEDTLNEINAFVEAEEDIGRGEEGEDCDRDAEKELEAPMGEGSNGNSAQKKKRRRKEGGEGREEKYVAMSDADGADEEASSRDEAIRTAIYDLTEQLYADLICPRIAVAEALLSSHVALALRTVEYITFAAKSIHKPFAITFYDAATHQHRGRGGGRGGEGEKEGGESLSQPPCFMPLLLSKYGGRGGGGDSTADPLTATNDDQHQATATTTIPLSWLTSDVLDEAEEVLLEQQQLGSSSSSPPSSSDDRKVLIALRVLVQEVPEQSRSLLDAVLGMARLFEILEEKGGGSGGGGGDAVLVPSPISSHNTSLGDPPPPSGPSPLSASTTLNASKGNHLLASLSAILEDPSLSATMNNSTTRMEALQPSAAHSLTSSSYSLVEQSPALDGLCEALLGFGVVDAEMWLEDTVRAALKRYRQRREQQQQQQKAMSSTWRDGASSSTVRRRISRTLSSASLLNMSSNAAEEGDEGEGSIRVSATSGGDAKTPTAQLSRSPSSILKVTPTKNTANTPQQQQKGGTAVNPSSAQQTISGSFSTPRKRSQMPTATLNNSSITAAEEDEVLSEGDDEDDDGPPHVASPHHHPNHHNHHHHGNPPRSRSFNSSIHPNNRTLLTSSAVYLRGNVSGSGGGSPSGSLSIASLIDALDAILGTSLGHYDDGDGSGSGVGVVSIHDSLALTSRLYDMLGSINLFLRRAGMAKETRTMASGKVVPAVIGDVGGAGVGGGGGSSAFGSTVNLLGGTIANSNNGDAQQRQQQLLPSKVFLEHSIDEAQGFGRRESVLYEQACLCYEQWSQQNSVRMELDALLSMGDEAFYIACDERDMLRPLFKKADEYCIHSALAASSASSPADVDEFDDDAVVPSSSAAASFSAGQKGRASSGLIDLTSRDLVRQRMDKLLIIRIKVFHHSGEVRVITIPQRMSLTQFMKHRVARFFPDVIKKKNAVVPSVSGVDFGCEVSFLDDGDKVRISSNEEFAELIKMRRRIVIEGFASLPASAAALLLGASSASVNLGGGGGRSQLAKSLMNSSELKLELYLDPLPLSVGGLQQQQPTALIPTPPQPSSPSAGVRHQQGSRAPSPSAAVATTATTAQQQQPPPPAPPPPRPTSHLNNTVEMHRLGLNELIRQQEQQDAAQQEAEDTLKLIAMLKSRQFGVGGGKGAQPNTTTATSSAHDGGGIAAVAAEFSQVSGFDTPRRRQWEAEERLQQLQMRMDPNGGDGGTYRLGSIGTTDLATFFDRKMAEKGLTNPPPLPPPPPTSTTQQQQHQQGRLNMFLAMGKARQQEGGGGVASISSGGVGSSGIVLTHTAKDALNNNVVGRSGGDANAALLTSSSSGRNNSSSVVMLSTQHSRWQVPPNAINPLRANEIVSSSPSTALLGSSSSSSAQPFTIARHNGSTVVVGNGSGGRASSALGSNARRPVTPSTLVIADTNTSDADEDEVDALIASPTWHTSVSPNAAANRRPMTSVDHIHAVMNSAPSNHQSNGMLRHNGPMRRGGIPLPPQAIPSPMRPSPSSASSSSPLKKGK